MANKIRRVINRLTKKITQLKQYNIEQDNQNDLLISENNILTQTNKRLLGDLISVEKSFKYQKILLFYIFIFWMYKYIYYK